MLHSKRFWLSCGLLLLMMLALGLSGCAGYPQVKPPEPTSTPLPPAPPEPPATATVPVPTPTPAPPTATPVPPTATVEPATAAPDTGAKGVSGDVQAGANLYAANCAACHGQAGEGGIAPPLAGLQASAEEAAAVVRDGKTGETGAMPPFGPRLSDDDIQNVLAFILSLDGAE